MQVDAGLPYVDGHTIRVALILRTEPPAGFEIAERRAVERLALVGRHRFSQYRLAFELSEAPDGATQLRAQTNAAFPGARGRVYRAVVVDSGAHALATHRILRSVRRLSVQQPKPSRTASAT